MRKNVPNILSAFRIVLVPVFVAAYFLDGGKVKVFAAVVYALATVTDFLDGFIARKYNLITNLGRVLDPIGDKLMTLAVLSCITIDRIIPMWVLMVMLVKEFLMMVGGTVIHRVARMDIPPSNYIGKTATVVFFIVCLTLMLFRGIPRRVARIMIFIALALTLMALGSYVMTFTATMKRAKEQQEKR